MATQTAYQHIVQTPGTLGGKPRIDGHRIAVEHVAVWHEQLGYSVEEIACDYGLTLAQVYAALTYYHDHKEVMDQSMKESEAFVEEMRKKSPSLLAKKLYEQSHSILP